MGDLGSFKETDALAVLRHLNDCDENTRCEAKEASECGRSLLETICAFSNEPHLGGGFILLGVAKAEDTLWPTYEPTGLVDIDKVQADIACQCRTAFSTTIRPLMKVNTIQNKSVILVFVPEAARTEKPVHFAAEQLPGGAYRRIGSTDQRCTKDDLIEFYGSQQTERYDSEILRDASMDDIDRDVVAKYRELRVRIKPSAEELQSSDEDLLLALACAKRDERQQLRPTVAGILLFGKKLALRRLFPMMRVDYIRLRSTNWVADPDESMVANVTREALITAIPRICDEISADLPASLHVREHDLQREQKQRLPDRVVREVVVNALMHRCYRTHGPTTVMRYPNRLEIRNPGHSLVSDERFGEPGSVVRNHIIAAVLYDIGYAETKGYGIKSMRELMRRSKLQPPVLESDREGNRFVAFLLLHHFWTEKDIQWLSRFRKFGLASEEQSGLITVRELGAIDSLTYRSMTGVNSFTATASLRKMCTLDLLQLKGKGSRTYYVPGSAMLAPSTTGQLTGGVDPKPGQLTGGVATQPGELENDDGEDRLEPLPEYLQILANNLPARAAKKRMTRMILALCRWRDLKASEIAAYCNRQAKHLRDSWLSELLDEGLLGVTEKSPNSPKLRYQITQKGVEWLRKDKGGGLPPVQ